MVTHETENQRKLEVVEGEGETDENYERARGGGIASTWVNAGAVMTGILFFHFLNNIVIYSFKQVLIF